MCGRGSADLRAAETFLLWLYRPAQRPALAGAGIIPVQSDPRAQARYWANKPADVRAVGDWTRFQAYMLGWPGIPPQNLMADAMAQAVADPGALPTALARAAGAMNAWVAKNGAA